MACPKCYKLYLYADAIQKTGTCETSKLCCFVRYPNHTQHLRREPCKAVFLKTIEFSSGRKILYPKKIFCYKSVKSTLQEFLLQPGFQQDCEHWRSRSICDDLRDVYVGNVWKKFQHMLGSELKDFWHGLPLKVRTASGIQEQKVRCAILCVACDLPGGRKVCGFLSHSAAKGCSKCLKVFPGLVGTMCYSGFDRSLWPPRTNEIH